MKNLATLPAVFAGVMIVIVAAAGLILLRSNGSSVWIAGGFAGAIFLLSVLAGTLSSSR